MADQMTLAGLSQYVLIVTEKLIILRMQLHSISCWLNKRKK
jgi:hypothetical protein